MLFIRRRREYLFIVSLLLRGSQLYRAEENHQKEKTTVWDFLSYGFRMSMEAKNEMNSCLDRTQTILTSSGGGVSLWRSTITAFIASRVNGSLDKVERRLRDNLSSEESTSTGNIHDAFENQSSLTLKEPFISTSKIKNEVSKTLMAESFINNSSTSSQDSKHNHVYHAQSNDNDSSDSSLIKSNQFHIQTQALDSSNIVYLRDNSKLTSDKGPHGLRALRKKAARVTGVHGFFSGKKGETSGYEPKRLTQELDENDLSIIRRRIAAIKVARERVAEKVAVDEKRLEWKVNTTGPVPFRRFFGLRRRSRAFQNRTYANVVLKSDNVEGNDQRSIATTKLERSETSRESLLVDNLERDKRLKEIERLILEGQRRIVQLQVQKELLQQQLNPLFNYSSTEFLSKIQDFNNTSTDIPRIFNFPSQQIVTEYIRELIDTKRLIKLNHTHLWRYESDEDDIDDIGDDLLTPSGDSQKLYEQISGTTEQRIRDRRSTNGPPTGGGSWLLRQSIGKGGSIGEKIGEMIETAAYRGICSAVMSFLARLIAQLHGLNVLTHSDVRLYMQNSPDLPPVSRKQPFDTDNYAQETLRRVIRKNSKRRKGHQRTHRPSTEDYFIQRNAVVETLLSHCQISAPLLKLFPLSWQRAMLGNCVTLSLAVIADFCENIQIPILGHILSLSLQPITEDEILHQIDTNRLFFNHRFAKPVEFEAAVRATALDISESFLFLDRWHERALGSDLLRAQLGNLVARLVLTLVDEILCGTRIDLWTSQAGGPRMLLGFQYK